MHLAHLLLRGGGVERGLVPEQALLLLVQWPRLHNLNHEGKFHYRLAATIQTLPAYVLYRVTVGVEYLGLVNFAKSLHNI